MLISPRSPPSSAHPILCCSLTKKNPRDPPDPEAPDLACHFAPWHRIRRNTARLGASLGAVLGCQIVGSLNYMPPPTNYAVLMCMQCTKSPDTAIPVPVVHLSSRSYLCLHQNNVTRQSHRQFTVQHPDTQYIQFSLRHSTAYQPAAIASSYSYTKGHIQNGRTTAVQ